MDFRVLGPLEVEDDGRAIALGPKQQGLLAILLLHRGEVVPADRLIEDLYGKRPPRTAAKSLQAHVSRLRKALGDGLRLRTASGGYVLEVPHGNLDLDRFEELVDRGRRAHARGDANAASAALTEALALWRGPAFADFRYADFAQAEIARLDERRLAILEDRIDADLVLGRHADLVGELETLVAEHPLRERPRGQLMTALYRCGRQAEALDVYTETRRLLTDELGLEPSETLKQLQRAILEHDPSLVAPHRVEAALLPEGREPAPTTGAFVGRENELAELRAGLDDALAGRGRLFLLVGEPGIGKSRLADELIGYARTQGARVLVGRCWEAGGAPAYWPWIQSLRAYIRDSDPEALREQLGAGAGDLAQLFPELRERFLDLPAPPPLESEGARFRLFDAAAAFLKSASRAQPIVLVLDDLHAADEPSLLLLEFLTRELGDSRLVIVGAYRDVDPSLRDPLVTALSELVREPVTRRMALSGLPEADVAEYISIAAGVQPEAATVAEIHAETDGNPLFVGEIVRLLVAEGRLEGTAGELHMPSSIREVIGSRMRRLSKRCQGILTAASVLGREFALDALQRLSQSTREELLGVLDEAMTERVIGEVPGASGRFRFAHALIRDTLYDELTPARRLQLHRQAGEALEHIYAADIEPHLAEVALHFFASAPAGAAGRAIEYARRAGDRAVSQLAYEEAVRLYGMALTLTDDELAQCELLLALGDAQTREGDEQEAKQTFLLAADVAQRLRVGEQLARAALGYGGRFVWARAGTDEHLVPLLERALAGLGVADNPLRVRVLARLAGALRDQHAREPRAALSEEAVQMARRIGDPETLAYALDGRCMATFWAENTEERIALATELIQLAENVGDRERAAAARYYRMMFLLELGDMSAVESELDAYAGLANELRQPAQLWLLVVTRATLALFQGRVEEGEVLTSEALERGQGAQRSDAVLSHRIQTFTLATQRGQLEGLDEMLTRSVAEYPARPMFRCMLTWLRARLGREKEARVELQTLAADSFAALPRTNEWLFSLGFLAEVAADLGDLDRVRTLYELLSPYATRNASTADYICTGSVARHLGLLATTMKRWEDAERHFEAALEMNERMGARPWLAYTQRDYGDMLLARGARGDRKRAEELRRAARELADELGMSLP